MSNLTKTLKALSEAAKLNATHPNHEGAPSYYRSLKEQVVQVLSTGTLGDTFYASGKELAADALHVLVEARAECPRIPCPRVGVGTKRRMHEAASGVRPGRSFGRRR